MLVMRRRAGDTILIGEDIQIEIIDISPTRVKIGITAPAETPIVRKEVLITRQQNLTAAQPVSGAALANFLQQLAVK